MTKHLYAIAVVNLHPRCIFWLSSRTSVLKLLGLLSFVMLLLKSEMVSQLKNDKIKIRINLLENLMIKIKLHFDYISIKIKFNLDYKKISVRFIID